MARPLRLEHPGAVWHVTSRGNERREIFCDDHDRQDFLRQLAGVVTEFTWRLHAYVLMGNHYHLLFETSSNPEKGKRPMFHIATEVSRQPKNQTATAARAAVPGPAP